MKTPLSPSHFIENGRMAFPFGACLELLELPPSEGPAPQLQLQQENRKLGYSLCGVCNLQLSSPAQAQVHYNGRSHLRRLRQLSHGDSSPAASATPAGAPAPHAGLGHAPAPHAGLGHAPAPHAGLGHAPAPHVGLGHAPGHTGCSLTCSVSTGVSPLPALVRTPPLMMQSSLDMKPFLSFPLDSSSPGGLFPNFNTMDPVQKAVINHTFGVSLPPKKKQVISCNICQLRFNSDSQAEAHYKGSKHAKKLKAQESGKPKASGAELTSPSAVRSGSPPSSSSSSCCLPAGGPSCLADTPECITPPSPEESSAPLPPPLISSSLGLAASPSLGQPRGDAPAIAPAPALALALAPTSPCPPLPASTALGLALKSCVKPGSAPGPALATLATPTAESEEEKAKKLLYCSLCKVAVNSLSQLEAHNTGSKHKTMLEARTGAGPIKAYPRPGAKLKIQPSVLKGSGLQNKTFHCQICDVHVNSEIQLKQHISSRRHKDRVAGKPMKPKYSPYNKQQRGSNTLAAKLALHSDLVKPLTPTFLSSPFCPTSVSSIALHPRPSPSIFQTATLPHSFLRAAPGPIRPTTGSILFAPY